MPGDILLIRATGTISVGDFLGSTGPNSTSTGVGRLKLKIENTAVESVGAIKYVLVTAPGLEMLRVDDSNYRGNFWCVQCRSYTYSGKDYSQADFRYDQVIHSLFDSRYWYAGDARCSIASLLSFGRGHYAVVSTFRPSCESFSSAEACSEFTPSVCSLTGGSAGL